MKKSHASALSLFVFLALCGPIQASTLFWSGNGTTQGGAGTWDTTTATHWGTANGGPFTSAWVNANNDTAVFAGTTAAVTVGSGLSITAGGIIFTNSSTGAFSISAGSPASVIVLSGNPTLFLDGNTLADSIGTNLVAFGTTKVTCAGTLIKAGGGRISFNNTGSSVGKLVVNGGCVATGNNQAASEIDAIMGAAPASLVTDDITLNGGGILFGAVANQTNPNKLQGVRGIVLGSSGGWIGSAQAVVVQVGGPISGPGDLIVAGKSEVPGQSSDNVGIVSLTNQANSYGGQTRVSAGELRLGTNNVLPTTTTVNVTNGLAGLAGSGKFNLLGFTNHVTKLLLDSAGASQVYDSVGGGKLYADEVELRGSTAGVSVSNAVFAGPGMLRKTTSGTISINSANTYTGDTRIEGGTLVLTNNGAVSGSFDNSANIAVYAGATLKVTNRLDGKLTVGAAQNLSGGGTIHGPVVLKGNVAPGANGTIGSLTVVGDQTWDVGSKYTWDINAASGTAGVDPGWDQLNITGGLTITATQANPMTIYITSRTLADALGTVSDFNNTTVYSWSIATTTTGITGFDANAFVIDTNGFSNPLDPSGVFKVTTNATDVLLTYSFRSSQTITFNALANQTYGDAFDPGATASSGLTVNYSIVSGPATVSGSTVTVTGVGPITVRASQPGNVNYAAAADVEQTFTATAAPLTVSAAAVSRAYGSSNPSFTATYTGFKLSETLGTSDLTGAPVLNTAATASSVPGSYPITVSAGTLASSHYALSYSDGALTVTQAVLTVTADDKTRPFNTANPTLTYTITGYVLGQNSGVVSGTATIGTTATISSNPGQYPITVTQGSLSAANYSFAFVSGTLTVSGFPLTVTAVSTNRAYGDPNPTFTVTYSGFVDSDDASVITGSPTFTTPATNTSTVAGGPYAITPGIGTLTAARYSFTTFVDGQLTITKRPLIVTANNTNRTYGAADPAFTASYSGFVNSDDSSVVRGSAQFSTTATAASTVAGGPYAITPTVGTLDADNYSFGSFVNGQLSITPAALSVTADNKSRAVGTANPTFTGVISASQNGDSFSATYSTSADINSPVGTYAIVPALVDNDGKAGNYNVTLNNGTLNVVADPTISGQPLARTNVAGTTATFSVTVLSAGPLQYQWQKGGNNIANATDSVLTLPSVSQSDAGSYGVVVTHGIDSTNSSLAKLTVVDPIVITSGPVDAAVPYGTTATFDVQVTGSTPITYQWRKDGVNLTSGGKVVGATTSTLSITNAVPGDVGAYSVVASNFAGAVTSATATIVLSDPGFVSQPSSRTNNVGDNAQFTVSAGGSTTLTYQWKLNGNNITDATNNVLNVAVNDSTNAGSYSAVVTDGNGSITSSSATLSVFFPTRTKFAQWNFNSTTSDNNVTTGIATASIGSGTQSLIGTATANGFNTGSSSDPNMADNSSRRWNGFPATAPNKTTGLKYAVSTVGYKHIAFTCELWVTTRSSAYWRAMCSVDNGTNWIDRGVINRLNAGGFVYFSDDLTSVSGAANNTNLLYEIVAEYEFTATGSGTNAYVSVDPTSTFSPTSSLFGMDLPTFLGDVSSPPIVQSSPSSTTVTAGDTVVFSASATGPSVTVVWSKDGNDIGAGSVATVGGVTTSTLTLENVRMGDAGNYLAKFSNTDATDVATSAATLTVSPATLVITSDSTTKVYGDANPTFTGTVSGTLPGDSFTVTYATVADGSSPVGPYEITQTIDDPSGLLINYVVTTNNGTLAVQQAALTVTADNKVKATGAANPTLTGSVVGLKNGDNITGNFTTTATDVSPAGDYTITAAIDDPDTKAGNYSISYNNGVLTVADAPLITSQPADLTVNSGDNAVLNVGATGTSIVYQWYKDNAPLVDGGAISGALSSSLTISSAAVADAGSYSVVVSNVVGIAASSNAVLNVAGSPSITSQPPNATSNAGSTATITVGVAGSGPLTYTWSRNGIALTDGGSISGSTTASLAIANLRRANAGTYSLVVSNSYGTVTSAPIALSVIDPAILTDPVGGSVTNGQTFVFSVVAGGTPTLKYQWYQSNLVTHATTKLIGKTQSTLTVGPADDKTGGGYYCVVNNTLPAPNSATSAVAILTAYVRSELIININGTGSGTTAHVGLTQFGKVVNHASLLMGRTYSVKAIPAAGCFFTNWTDGNGNVLTNGTTLKNFVMYSNLVLNANFMTNSVIAGNVAGKYNGLFYEITDDQPDIKVASAGLLFSLSVKDKVQNGPGSKAVGFGPVSGSILVDGVKKGIAGIFDLDGNMKKNVKLEPVVVSRSTLGKPDLSVDLHLDWVLGTHKVTGTISNMTEGGWVSHVSADLAVTNTTDAKYTMAINASTNTAELPGGSGFGTITRKANGNYTLSGKVADGQPIAETVMADVNGKLPFYSKLYSNGGLLLGWLDISSGAPTGDLTWIKPNAWSNPKNINYTGGFNAKFGVTGSAYTAPPVGTRILTSDSNNYLVTATDIGIGTASTLSWNVNLTTANKFVVLPGSATNLISLTVKSTGEISLKFRPTGAGKSIALDKVTAGVVLQSTTNMVGAFQNTGTIGGVTVQPVP